MLFICAHKSGNRHGYTNSELCTLLKRLAHNISTTFLAVFNQVPCLVLKHNSYNYQQCKTEKAGEKGKSYCTGN